MSEKKLIDLDDLKRLIADTPEECLSCRCMEACYRNDRIPEPCPLWISLKDQEAGQ